MPRRLAEIVIDTGLASRDAVIQAIQRADRDALPLVAVLVRHLRVDELALVAAIRRHVRVAIIDPKQAEHDPDALRELPRDVCSRLCVMPLAVVGYEPGARTLQLAMADPTDTVAMAEIEHITGCQVESALMPLSAIEELIERGYRQYVTEVMPRERATFGREARITPRPATRPEPAAAPEDDGEPAGASTTAPSTVPFHRVADEASLEIRHQALLALLVHKGVISGDEYDEQVRQLMKRRDDDG